MQMGMGSAVAFGIFGPATAEMTGRIAEVTLEVYGLLLPPRGGIVSVSNRGEVDCGIDGTKGTRSWGAKMGREATRPGPLGYARGKREVRVGKGVAE